ncbi:pyruvoyl-dependent arginine decarboxylase [Nesterenkonia sp. LB17]|nr:pyruvoyl-dependent arginine decarboxylase [Nesterenkonia sp. DZ6]MCH8564931.1 pyruvoyl-dependent arginine decarboxylase [Nesterenkonia sp. LB17]MCH8571869.1 pyruvoyl-dependent arginine decarboxylase [Nesterenkonia sp. AY15]
MTIHAGSYHLALHDAGIEMANIMTYSSILPKTAVLKEYPGRKAIAHGEVMESIVAEFSCGPGERATAGIIYGLLHDENGEKQGGLVCEFGGGMGEEDVKPHLRDMLDELYYNGYQHFELSGIRYIVESIVPSKAYGTAIAALCFMNYIYPVVADD